MFLVQLCTSKIVRTTINFDERLILELITNCEIERTHIHNLIQLVDIT